MSTKDGDGPGTSQESAAGPAAGSAGDPSTVAAAGDASNLGRRLPTQQVDGEPELATTAALLRRAFTETHKYEPGYLKWFYIDNPEGQVVAFDHDDDGRRVGHYALVPQRFVARDSEPITMGLSVDTAVDPEVRLKGLFVQLANKTYDASRELGWAGAYGAANANSTPGCTKRLGFEYVMPLPVRAVVAPWRWSVAQGWAEVTPSYLNSVAFAELAATIDFSPGTRLSHQWDAELLAWRLRSPAGRYVLFWNKDAVMVTSQQPASETITTVVLKLFPRLGAPPRSSALQLVGHACRHHRTPFAVYAGFNSRFRLAGVPIPRRFLPSPLNLLVRPLAHDLSSANFDLETIEFLDFDQY